MNLHITEGSSRRGSGCGGIGFVFVKEHGLACLDLDLVGSAV